LDFDQLKVYAWGCNVDGRLGINSGSKEEVTDPKAVESLRDIVFVSAGRKHTAAIDSKGVVYLYGDKAGTGQPTQSGHSGDLGPTIFKPRDLLSTDVIKFVACGHEITVIAVEQPDGSCKVRPVLPFYRFFIWLSSDLFRFTLTLINVLLIQTTYSLLVKKSDN